MAASTHTSPTNRSGGTARSRPRSLLVLGAIVGLSVVAAGCGGSSDGGSDGEAGASSASSTTPSSTSPSTEESADGASTSEDASSGGVTVTVGDSTWEFDVDTGFSTQCTVHSGDAVTGSGDGINVAASMMFDLAADRPEQSSMTVEALDGSYEWVADSSGSGGGIDSAVVDGRTVTGTATFVDATASGGTPVEGSFDITCP